MASERIQRRIELLLDEADQAVAISEWELVLDRANTPGVTNSSVRLRDNSCKMT